MVSNFLFVGFLREPQGKVFVMGQIVKQTQEDEFSGESYLVSGIDFVGQGKLI